MCSSSVRPEAPARKGPSSISFRVGLLCAVATATLFSAALGLLTLHFEETLEDASQNFLTVKLDELAATIDAHGDDPRFLVHEVHLEADVYRNNPSHVFYSRVLDDRDTVLIEAPGMAAIAARELFPRPAGTRRHATPDGRSWLLATRLAPAGAAGPRVLQGAIDVTDGVRLANTHRRDALLALASLTLLAGALGVLVARHALRPLREVVEAMERLELGKTQPRLGSWPWPRELQAMARAFDTMRDRIDGSFARLSELSTDLAHELRTPLTNLVGEAEVVLSRDRSSQEYRRVLESSLEELGRLRRMINEMLFLARAEQPQSHLARASLDARHEIDLVAQFFHPLVEEHEVSLTTSGAAKLDADPLLLRRAVTNLLANALAHTPPGGHITVSVETRGDEVVLRIDDTGEGIPPERLEALFTARNRGRGLAIVKSIISLHQGSLSVESVPGQGTHISLKLPVHAPRATVRRTTS
ncbi:MAG: heavy metal sensor histidine kinase [Archangium sp.]|nr:heavy metal sensor histidine kinase [Archangium sp.]